MAIKFIKKVVPSNKTETLPAKQYLDGGSTQTDLKPFIDKISIVVPILSSDASAVFNNIWTQVGDTDVFQDAGGKAKSGGFKLAKRINLASTTAKPLLQLAYADKKALKMRLEFNPRKVTPEGVSELQSVLMSVVPDGWAYVIAHGHITRLDVAVDIPAARPGMFVILPQQGLTTKEWAVNGKLQTFVMGKKAGNQTSIYNKKQQRLAQGKVWDGRAVTRVERRLRNPSPSALSQLTGLANPFGEFQLTEMVSSPPPNQKPWIWELFRDAVSVRGLPAALALLPKERRTSYRAYLKQHPHKAWDAASIWKHWPESIKLSQLLL